ncbi:phage tail protein [Deinococcus cellulosilyticus]|uniref:Uncharacterized protein n=1 Tax=Deinococcus cellulosilyticus (strain DSM 18568 / NBRC 106333 / KACC 11606 / 5516J-15) TaxID=1223518 RepID=A0A511N0V8_DEIC1|nr:hypothetical protein [Deinococcus cellulosilyticus]GEM46026.1 hypothetical protein DC3_16610 [Deinococcus cellulosilyticus NBRC 106333 = KACC 11606]
MTGKAPAPRKSTGPVTPAARKGAGGTVMGKTSVQIKGKAAQDPRFQKTVKNLQDRSRQLGKHEPASKKRSDLENAAQDPANARSAGAAASQVATMDSAPTGTVQPGSFTTLLRQEIDRLMPQTLENADQFMQHGEASQIQQAAGGAVQQQTDDAAGTLQATAAQAPDPAGQPVRTPQPMGTEAPPAPPVVDPSGAVPPPKKNFDAGLKQNLDTSKDEIKKTELPESSFQKANDSRFSKVIEQNKKLQSQTARSIQGYPKTETQIQGAAKAAVSGDSKKGAAALVKARMQGSAVVRVKQQTAKERNEARRKAVVDNIERIYNKTKTAAQNHIEGLQEKAMHLFEQGLNRASENLKRNAELEKQKFRNERYSGVTGAARWVADLFRECPDGLKEGFRRARAKFTQETDVLVGKVGHFVDSRIKAAKAEIQRGQAEIQTYVQSLPADLQSVGQNAQKDMESRFSEMQQNIDSQAQELAQKLAERYQKAQEDADNAIKKLEEENSGMLKGLIDAVGEVIKILREFKARLQAALRKGEETIKLILNDPIGFLSNLLAAIKGGLNAFVGNIWTHLKAGFMQWLFGSLMKAGIQPPVDLSLGSIFKLVLQVLGITYDRMRAKAVKLIGERNVKILEKLFAYIQTLISGGIQALWEKVKEDLSNLKQMVIDAIQNWLIETVIKQAIMKVVSMFNPAGAIVQAVITIYNTVMFLWEKANQILSFVEAVINSIHAIATGAIGGAVSWIERSLASMIPLVIGFLARLIGLGNVSNKIREFILKVQGKVDAAIDKVIAKIVATVKKLFGKGQGSGPEAARERLQQGLQAGKEAVNRYAGRKVGVLVLRPLLAAVRVRYRMTVLEPRQQNGKWAIYGKVNPDGTEKSEAKAPEAATTEALKATAATVTKISKAAENGKKAFAAGLKRELDAIRRNQARGGVIIPTKPEEEQAGPGLDNATLFKAEDPAADVAEIGEVKSGRPRLFKSRASGRAIPTDRPVIHVPPGTTPRELVKTNPAIAKQIIQDRAVLVQNSKVVQNQLSAITENFKTGVDKMNRQVEEAIKKGTLDPNDAARFQSILQGKGGTLKFVLDLEAKAKMKTEDLEVAQSLVQAAFDGLVGDAANNKTKIELVIRNEEAKAKT